MNLEKILSPVADPEHPGAAPALASAIASRVGASLTLLHVVDQDDSDPSSADSGEAISSQQLNSTFDGDPQNVAVAGKEDVDNLSSLQVTGATGEAADIAENQLKAYSANNGEKQVPTAVTVVSGKPSETIPSMAHMGEFDLVVMESVRGSRIAKMLLGSTADEVESELQIPVVMLQPDDDARSESGLAPDALIVPLDSEPDSEHVISLAKDLARTLDCGIELVHAVTNPAFVTHPAAPLTTPVAVALDSQVDDGREYLERIAADITESGTQARITVDTGNPVDLIRKVADGYKNALIVTDSSERSGIIRLLFGRLSEDLVLNTSNPVMIVPKPLGAVID